MVRRVGKSPPGGATEARPVRASSGPSSSTEPRSRPTSARSGSWLRTSRHWMRSVVLPMPSTSAPRSSSSRAITSTSAMRGTLVERARLAGEQRRRHQRQRGVLVALDVDDAGQAVAAFDDERGHDGQGAAGDDQSPRRTISSRSVTPKRSRTASRQRSDQRRRCRRRWRVPSLTMKLPCVGETRAPPMPLVLEPGAIDERAGRRRDALGHHVAAGLRVLEDAAGARRGQRLGPLAEGQRLAGHRPQRLRRAARADAERRPQHHLAGALQPAGVVGELEPIRRHLAQRAVGSGEPHALDQVADVGRPPVRVAVDRPADRPRRPGPGLEAAAAVGDRPAHQAVDGHRRRRRGPGRGRPG